MYSISPHKKQKQELNAVKYLGKDKLDNLDLAIQGK